jgi:hypothetical protein
MSGADAQTRAFQRRLTWAGGRAASFEELDEKDLEFWANAEPAAKLLPALADPNAEYLIVGGWPVGYYAAWSVLGLGSFPRRQSPSSCPTSIGATGIEKMMLGPAASRSRSTRERQFPTSSTWRALRHA